MITLTKNAIDLGIVTKDSQKALKFYRDTLGFDYQGDMAIPGGHMHRLMCGESMIKIVEMQKPPAVEAQGGGLQSATGYRYWTISVSNLSEILNTCQVAGYKIAMPETQIREGISIGFVEDPDGNWIEFLQMAKT